MEPVRAPHPRHAMEKAAYPSDFTIRAPLPVPCKVVPGHSNCGTAPGGAAPALRLQSHFTRWPNPSAVHRVRRFRPSGRRKPRSTRLAPPGVCSTPPSPDSLVGSRAGELPTKAHDSFSWVNPGPRFAAARSFRSGRRPSERRLDASPAGNSPAAIPREAAKE
jgi:hypothetical protein